MAREKTYTSNSVFDGDEVSYRSGNDIERLREIESDAVKTESGKIGIAGLMAMAAALGLIATGAFSTLLGSFGILEALQAIFLTIGAAAGIYGGIKTLIMLSRKSLNMPSLEVLRKTVAQQQPNVNVGGYTQRQQQNQTSGNQVVRTQTWKRSRKQRVFAGVAGGLAEYLGIAPILVRIAFLVAMPATGMFFFPFVYLLLALVLPKNYDDWGNRNK